MLFLPRDIDSEYDALLDAKNYLAVREAELLVTVPESSRLPGLMKELEHGQTWVGSKLRRVERLEKRLFDLRVDTGLEAPAP